MEALERSSEGLEPWIPRFTWLVAIGVVLEIVVVLIDHKGDMNEWRRSLLHPERPSTFKLWLEIASVVLVTVGILGELGVGLQISSTNGQLRAQGRLLRSKNDQLLALVTQQAGDAKDSSLSAQASANAASLVSDKAKKEADGVAKQANELSRQVSNAETQLKVVDDERAKLAKSLKDMAICSSPRIITDWMANGKTYVDPLRPFAEYKAIIEVVPDPEARRAAANIQRALSDAGWIIVGPLPPSIIMADGVQIESYNGLRQWNSKDFPVFGDSSKAADAVMDFLHSYFWKADSMSAWSVDTDIPPNGVKIRVGLYPADPFLVPPGAKEAAVAGAKIEQEIEEQMKQSSQKALEDLLKRLTPQEGERLKASSEDWHKQTKLMSDRYKQPCQSFNLLP
jgi:hypothetical protein